MGKCGDLALEAVANPLRGIEKKLINSVLFYTPQTESSK